MPPPSSSRSSSKCGEKREELTAAQVFLLYRKGVTEQRRGNLPLALHCLQPLIPFFCNTPLIWVRILEIGIRLLYYGDNVNEGRALEFCGSGRSRKAVLAPKNHVVDGRPSAALCTHIAEKTGISEDYLESIAGVLLCLTNKTKDRQLRFTSLSLATYVALKMGRYHYAAELAHKMIDEDKPIEDASITASMYLMECILVNGPFSNAVKVIDLDEKERKTDEWSSFPVWSVIDRCIILCANRKYLEAETLYNEIKSSPSANMLFKRNVLSLGVFIYSKMRRAADASQLLDELQKIQDEEDHYVVDRRVQQHFKYI